jgi:signal transduction histidine kinase
MTLCLPRRAAEDTPPTNIVPGVRGADWRKLLVVPFSAPNAWTGHLYVMDPACRPRGESRLRLLSDLVRQATPALLNLYLLRRLRWRAESAERSRISRELHDTANQSLAAIGMRLDLLARHSADGSCPMTAEIRDLQALVRSVDLDLRESVSQPPQDLDAERLPIALLDIVGRFSRQSGIEAHLDWLAPRLNLPPQRCSEVARILQEALFNVRRHSRATRVAVRVEALPNGWALIVEDNGQGLGFTGRLSGNEPEMQLKGPRVIRERALALGGSIAIESSDSGARLELTFPQQR